MVILIWTIDISLKSKYLTGGFTRKPELRFLAVALIK